MSLLIQDLTAGYARRRVIEGFSPAPFHPGTVTALIGPNAAGKSTFLRAIAGLMPAKGTVRLDDTDLTRLRHADRVRRIRYVPQAYATTASLSVFDAVLVALKQAPGIDIRGTGDDTRTVAAILHRLGIADLAERGVAALSGGQQQMVALAQGLVTPAPVLLLDEPTSALDLQRQLQVLALLNQVAAERDAIVILALHDLALAGRHTDRVLLLEPGRIAADGTPEDVLSSPACERAYGVHLAVERNSRGSITVEAHL
ncbi:ABC transporter ATP-binding protein [Roseomonas sp. CCTCC AB2023176]|uniref:ABC transporter ATP-binding protein n=1 Tax=Roseomonas sp. CCTCC AB2023176 TaxID=3342640 RepID=UPI0035DF2732